MFLPHPHYGVQLATGGVDALSYREVALMNKVWTTRNTRLSSVSFVLVLVLILTECSIIQTRSDVLRMMPLVVYFVLPLVGWMAPFLGSVSS